MDLLALKHLLREVGDFLEEEAENRAQAGSTMSDYARQPHKLMERIDMALAALPPKNAPLASVSPSPAPEPVAWAYINRDGECEQIEWGAVPDALKGDPDIFVLYDRPGATP